MLRIASGVTDQFVYFHPGDLGLSSFTVYRSRNGAAAVAMTTPTINETDSSNMPGEYELLLDEDMTIGGGNLTEHMVFWITADGMVPQRVEIELFASAAAEVTTDLGDTPDLLDIIQFLYQAVRNQRDTTASSDEVHTAAGVVVVTATISDDGVLFRKTKAL